MRSDPFSTYKSGFELRQYRLCKRVLIFHHFDELGSNPILVRSTELTYQESEKSALLKKVVQKGYKQNDDNSYQTKAFPPVVFNYSEAEINDELEYIDSDYLENIPHGVNGMDFQWLDLEGEGLSGIFTESNDGWYFQTNRGEGTFTSQRLLNEKPYPSSGNGQPVITDVDGDGSKELVLTSPVLKGFFDKEDGQRQNFKKTRMSGTLT